MHCKTHVQIMEEIIMKLPLFCGLVWSALLTQPALAGTPDIKTFASMESTRDVTISPDGHYLAFIRSAGGRRLVTTIDLSNKGGEKPVLTSDKDNVFDLTWCHWANNTRLLCGYRAAVVESGMTYRVTRMVAVDANGANQKVLMQNSSAGGSQFQDEILDWTPDEPDTVLVQAMEDENIYHGASIMHLSAVDQYPCVFELNVYTGRLSKKVSAHPPIIEFTSDGKGQVRLGSGYQKDKEVYYARLAGSEEWQQLNKIEVFSPTDALIAAGVIPGSNQAYAFGASQGHMAVWQIDLLDKHKPWLIFDNPRYDIQDSLHDRDGTFIGVTYETTRPKALYVDPYIDGLVQGVDKVLPGRFNTVHSSTSDRKTFVIRSASDRDAGSFYLFESGSETLRPIGMAYPELPSEALATMQSIEYPARDGEMIPGYLSVPLGSEGHHLPLIVMPHGGPMARDSWEFDFLRHFLLSRGYAVLQMNFRGSSGYGGEWFFAAHQDWGGLTYSDITDAARWAVAQGIADPRRMCIVGWSFGGYAALLGAERNADLYRCSVSIAGVSDLLDLEAYNKTHFRNGALVSKQIGENRQKLQSDSPALHAADVKMPVLLIHGDHDAQVPLAQSKEMDRALKRADKNHKLVVIEGGDHQLWRPAERETMLTEVEKFLNANLQTTHAVATQ
jgi:dipeptidyl aminopeptidase/acylaminoacyl peptidase